MTNEAAQQSSTSQKLASRRRTIDDIGKLLLAKPAAEELHETWEQPRASRGEIALSSLSRAVGGSSSKSKREPRLSDLWRSLDARKSVQLDEHGRRGVPMWIVVRTCKAAWHRNGTWPLLGCDEETPASGGAPERSIHPGRLLLRPEGVDRFTIPEDPQAAERRPPPPAQESNA